MKKTQVFLCLAMLTLLALGACQPTGTAAQPASPALTDGLGKSFPAGTPAQRIISLSPPLTEMLFAVGAGGQVIGRDSYSDYPAEAKQITDVGWTYGKSSLENVVNLKPDLVLAGEITTAEQVASLENLGMRVYYFKNPVTLGEVYTMLTTLGRLSGHESQAVDLVEGLQEREAALDKKMNGISQRPTVFYENDASDPSKPYTPGPGTLYNDLIAKAGGENIGAKLKSTWAQMSLEQLLVDDPDLILLGDANFGTTPESVAQRAGWQSLTAVQQGRVLAFDDNLLVRYGARNLDGLEALAKLLHPELFQQP
jgi:iron complex transport system substrate-binding protein